MKPKYSNACAIPPSLDFAVAYDTFERSEAGVELPMPILLCTYSSIDKSLLLSPNA